MAKNTFEKNSFEEMHYLIRANLFSSKFFKVVGKTLKNSIDRYYVVKKANL
jgi:hypothetical protein